MAHQQEEDPDHFSALIDDCICHIFDRLPLDDLCLMSRTSKKFKRLSEDYFQRKYPTLVCQPINIIPTRTVSTINLDGKNYLSHINTVISFQENHANYFGRLIRHVRIHFQGRLLNEELLQFIRLKCCKRFKMVSVHGTWTRSFADGIKELLQEAETVEFAEINNCYCRDIIFNHLPMVKQLSLKSNSMGMDILSRIEYPNLSVLHVEMDDLMPGDELFPADTSIKRLMCTLHSSCELGVWMKRIMVICARSNIGELSIENFSTGSIDFALIRKQLKELEARENFKRLDLNLGPISTHNSHLLASIKALNAFHLHDFKNRCRSPPQLSYKTWDRQITAISSFHNLKTLYVRHYFNIETDLSLLEGCLPRLTSLKELNYEDKNYESIQEILSPFIRHSRKLAQIFVINYRFSRENTLNIRQLNALRKNLKDASKVMIHLQSENRPNKIGLHSSESADLIEIKQSSF